MSEQTQQLFTAELCSMIPKALAQWFREGGKSAGPEGPVVAFGKRIKRGGVMTIVGRSIRGHLWAAQPITPTRLASCAKISGAKPTPATARLSARRSPVSCCARS